MNVKRYDWVLWAPAVLALLVLAANQGRAGDKASSKKAPAAGNLMGQTSVAPTPPKPATGTTRIYSSGRGEVVLNSYSGIPPLVLRFSEGDEEAKGVLEEDLNIMAHVIERSLQHDIGDDEAMGIKMLYTDAGRSVRGMYLDGFGALFMIKVRFPVFTPTLSEAKEARPSSGSEWEKAKRELYTEAEAGHAGEMVFVAGSSQSDTEKVDDLKKALLQTMKEAANFRHLKSEDFVGITVFGQPSTMVQVKKGRSKAAAGDALQGNLGLARAEGSANRRAELAAEEQKAKATALAKEAALVRSSAQGTVLALRARKADVDAFGAGKLDFESFQKRVEQNSYCGSGFGITSINSWTKGSSGGGNVIAK